MTISAPVTTLRGRVARPRQKARPRRERVPAKEVARKKWHEIDQLRIGQRVPKVGQQRSAILTPGTGLTYTLAYTESRGTTTTVSDLEDEQYYYAFATITR